MTSRKEAVDRGLQFIFEHSLAGAHFDEWAGDYLWCFYCISRTASDPELRRRALEMGAESARRWYAGETAQPALADAGEVAYYISLMDVARRLGVDDPALREHVGRKFQKFTARDYLGFDPVIEPPPDDLPAACSECETQSARGSLHCFRCGTALEMRSEYDVWCDALVLTYTADGFGMPLGAPHFAVASWAHAVRPYPTPETISDPKFHDVVYAITHLIYTLNDYSRFHLQPEWLPDEFGYLRAHLQRPIDAGDAELLGEFLDCLRCFGLTDADPGIAAGVDYLLAHQNADGSWGDLNADVHKRYHTTWTAIDALREYQWEEFGEAPAAIRRACYPKVFMDEFRLITVDPGHFHAALIQKSMYAGVSNRVGVYAPLGPDLIEHLNRISRFNLRAENPTSWELNVQTGPDFLERMLAEPPGNIVVLSGRNRAKIGRIRASLDAGLHVLADKPWIIRPEDLPELEAALSTAARKGLVAYDIMTERFEITSMLQRELVNETEVFGEILPGSPEAPSVYMESVHHILKLVAGAPNLRPVWFFDIAEQGESLADVGTHLVDLVHWTLFSETAIDYRGEIRMIAASRWPTRITPAQFRQVTGTAGDGLDYYCNTSVTYALRGVHTKLDVLWNWEAPEGAGDTHYAVYRGSRAMVEVRQGKQENYRPELYVTPNSEGVAAALRKKVDELAKQYPGVGLEGREAQFRITIPDQYRVGHEAHFAQVTNQFFAYLKRPETLPVWETPNMLAKYYVSTKGVELSRTGQ